MWVWNRWWSRLASILVKPRNDSRSVAGSSSAHIATLSVLRNGIKCSPFTGWAFYESVRLAPPYEFPPDGQRPDIHRHLAYATRPRLRLRGSALSSNLGYGRDHDDSA